MFIDHCLENRIGSVVFVFGVILAVVVELLEYHFIGSTFPPLGKTVIFGTDGVALYVFPFPIDLCFTGKLAESGLLPCLRRVF